MLGYQDVVQHAQRGKQADVLEGASDAEIGDLVRRRRKDPVRHGVGVHAPDELYAVGRPLVEPVEQLSARLGVGGLDFRLFGLGPGVERFSLFLVLLRVELPDHSVLGRGDLRGALRVQFGERGERVRVVEAVIVCGVALRVLAEVLLCHLPARVVADDGLAHEFYAPVSGLVYAGDAVERGRLPRAVRAYQGDDFAPVHLEREVAHGDDAAELHGHIFHADDVFNVLTHWRRPPFLLPSPLLPRPRPRFRP